MKQIIRKTGSILLGTIFAVSSLWSLPYQAQAEEALNQVTSADESLAQENAATSETALSQEDTDASDGVSSLETNDEENQETSVIYTYKEYTGLFQNMGFTETVLDEEERPLLITEMNVFGQVESRTAVSWDEDGKSVWRTYDAEGLLSEEIQKNENGDPLLTRTYDGSGILEETTQCSYRSDGTLEEMTKYDEAAYVRNISIYNENGDLVHQEQYVEDEEEWVLEKTYDGTLLMTETKTDGEGILLQTISYLYEGELCVSSEMVYYPPDNSDPQVSRAEMVYDSEQRLTQKTTSNALTGTVTTVYTYEYEEDGSTLRTVILYLEDGDISEVTESVLDSDGKELEWIHYQADGDIDYSWMREYDEEGNFIYYMTQSYQYRTVENRTFDENGMLTGAVQEKYEGDDLTYREILSLEYSEDGDVLHFLVTEEEDGETYKGMEAFMTYSAPHYASLILGFNGEKYEDHDEILYVLDENRNMILTSGDFDEEGTILGGYTEYEADPYGRILVTREYENVDSLRPIKKTYEYDEDGRVILETSYLTDTVVSGSEAYEYDEKGVKIHWISYRANGSVEEEEWYNSGSEETSDEQEGENAEEISDESETENSEEAGQEATVETAEAVSEAEASETEDDGAAAEEIVVYAGSGMIESLSLLAEAFEESHPGIVCTLQDYGYDAEMLYCMVLTGELTDGFIFGTQNIQQNLGDNVKEARYAYGSVLYFYGDGYGTANNSEEMLAILNSMTQLTVPMSMMTGQLSFLSEQGVELMGTESDPLLVQEMAIETGTPFAIYGPWMSMLYDIPSYTLIGTLLPSQEPGYGFYYIQLGEPAGKEAYDTFYTWLTTSEEAETILNQYGCSHQTR